MSSGPPAAVTVVVGQEEFLVEREVRRARQGDAGRPPEVSEPVVADLVAAQVAELLSPGLFGDERVVLLRGLPDAAPEVVSVLAGFAADPADGVRVVATHPGTAKGKAALDKLVAAGARRVQVASVRSARERAQFVAAEVAAAGGRITPGAADELVRAVGSDLRELAAASAQLAADSGGSIDEAVVSRYHRGRAEAGGFPVADRVLDGDLAGALEMLEWALSIGTKPVQVTAAVATQLRLTARVAAAGRRAGVDELAGAIGKPAWRVKRVLPWARAWHPDALSRAVAATAAADAEIKGGGADAVFAVTRLLVSVTAARAGR